MPTVLPLGLAIKSEDLANALWLYKRASTTSEREAATRALHHVIDQRLAHVLTHVPSWDLLSTVPGRQSRASNVRDLLEATSWGASNEIEDVLTVLEYEKDAHQPDAGRFESEPVWDRDIVLFDDTFTRGATALSAARALYDAGASSVTVVVIGRYGSRDWLPDTYLEQVEQRSDEKEFCPACKERLRSPEATEVPRPAGRLDTNASMRPETPVARPEPASAALSEVSVRPPGLSETTALALSAVIFAPLFLILLGPLVLNSLFGGLDQGTGITSRVLGPSGSGMFGPGGLPGYVTFIVLSLLAAGFHYALSSTSRPVAIAIFATAALALVAVGFGQFKPTTAQGEATAGARDVAQRFVEANFAADCITIVDLASDKLALLAGTPSRGAAVKLCEDSLAEQPLPKVSQIEVVDVTNDEGQAEVTFELDGQPGLIVRLEYSEADDEWKVFDTSS